MHDAKGRELKIGDTVLIPATVTGAYPTPDYCNVTLTSVYGRKPDANKETYCTNAAVVLRANPGDDNSEIAAVAPVYDSGVVAVEGPFAPSGGANDA